MPNLWRSAGKVVLPGKRSLFVRVAYGAKGPRQRGDSQNKEDSAPTLAVQLFDES